MFQRPIRPLLLLAGLMLLSGDLSAQQTVITEDDVAATRTVTAAVISPDGQQVAYVLSVPRNPKADESGAAWSQLHVVDREGRSRAYVAGQVNVSAIQWSPDGSLITYLAKRKDDQQTKLYAISVSGGESEELAALKTSISGYTWRPDGGQIVLLGTEVQDDEVKKLRDKGFNAEIYEEQGQNTRLWLVDADSATDDEPRLLEIKGSASEVHYSPDGARLAVALADTPLIDHFYMYRRLHVVDADSGQVISKIENPGKLGVVAWSPDGQYLSFTSGEDINDPSEGRLMIASASGGSPREIMRDYLPNITAIHWRDDETILFTADDGCATAMGQVKADGSDRLLFEPGGTILTGMSASADGSMTAFLGAAPEFPNEVFVSRVSTSLGEPEVDATDGIEARDLSLPPKRLTVSNPWLAERRLADQEVVRYEAKSDGQMVEGILVYPLDYDPGKRYPLIVTVHGGPESHVANGWVTSYSNPGQLGAARGFAVFYPNYRGSTGRGVAFAKAHQADYGGQEFDDVIDGVDYLIDRGIVDKDKVGITGGSYGGFATAWCSTRHSERFAAGVMFVGISNQISKSGTTDIPDEMFHVHARKRIWDDWQFFLERSPIYHVQNCRTPLLILHGKNDTRVHPSQSMELYRNLKILGQAPVRLVFYPGEGHGNAKSAARYDYNLRLMRWFTHYLQGPGGDAPDHALNYNLGGEEEQD